eukprot:gnl/TRDRNA2_/TRDRNA2_81970_c0_seq1.p1 gnl/TRDRNA2_/TRDRNA2_81970_c0~~gnl/TRDRNA2_/TRDRNA2_81970_c0_seq1.p1  ORF type:complete len:373 (+),score=90.94 gnl/TRDRNA2_/TRDRNA2_81970_c0_seq1:60-1178(+)
MDVLKKLKKDAGARQRRGGKEATPRHEPGHGIFASSSNWKSLLQNKPKVAPKAAARQAVLAPGDEGATTDVVAMDCEMVGVGPEGTRSILARVSIVDHDGNVLIDRLVRPRETVTDYRFHVTGINAEALNSPKALDLDVARRKAAEIMEGKIVVGHALQHDFAALMLTHPHELIRDTAIYKPLRLPNQQKKTPSLKRLAEYWLHEVIRTEGTHDSVEDARIALRLYRLRSRAWEKQMRSVMQQFQLASTSGTSKSSAPSGPGDEDDDDGEPVERDAGAGRSVKRKTSGGTKATEPGAVVEPPAGLKSKKPGGKMGKLPEAAEAMQPAGKKKRRAGKLELAAEPVAPHGEEPPKKNLGKKQRRKEARRAAAAK